MKEATGELNMTVITVVAVGAILALFWFLWPKIKGTIENTWNNTAGNSTVCPAGTIPDGKGGCQ